MLEYVVGCGPMQVRAVLFLCGFWFFSAVNLVHAGTVGIEFNGLSTHFSSPPRGAPRKIDPNGVNVFNPGLGIDYDFRENALENGLYGLIRTGYFMDCSNYFAVYGGIGFRYRKKINESIFWGASLLGGIYSTEDKDNTSPIASTFRTYSPLLTPGVELGFRVREKSAIKLNTTYAPILNLLISSIVYSF